MVRVLEEYRDHIIDFGAGHSVYEDPESFGKVEKAMLSEPFVFLLIPSQNREKSALILCERSGLDFNRHFVDHESNYKLAKQIVYTEDREPEETMKEILSQILNEKR
ncbi:hypothetical protein ACFSVM_12115 [Paenibacillus shunpengii]|uniref:Uncharacterized protein n=1 Tax=Paenibacillus shunpengii TaxID=2054424 RepID=A0ABW5SQU2_9BACL